MSVIFKHSQLGNLKGNKGEKVAQFLGLQYARLSDRFAPPELRERYEADIDTTKYGPPPISPPGAIHREFSFIQHTLPLPDVPSHSDLEGLSLNITVPMNRDGEIDQDAKLPVYIFIHGGGFAVGSSWYPHYDSASIVKRSIQIGKPMIGITINYRLGVTGFVTSKELRDAGYQPNNGLHDQRTAMRWIKKFIGGFGGDPNEMTAVGESAGGLSVTMFLCSKEPIMKRCLSTGGAVLLFKPLSLDIAETAYQQVVEAFGLKDKSPQDRIKALLEIPTEDLWQKVPMNAPILPVVDCITVPGIPDFKMVSSQADNSAFLMPGRKWCKALMIGESKLDANILAYMGLDSRAPNIAQKFIDSANSTLASQPEIAAQLLAAYGISPDLPDDDAILSVLRFASEIAFYAPARAFAQGWPSHGDSKFYLYHFNEGIPWEGRFQGEAGHILDVAYLFQNYNNYLNDKEKAVAVSYADDFISFVNGEAPWPPASPPKLGARVYGPSGGGKISNYVADGLPKSVDRGEQILKLGETAGFDNILDVFQNFLQGR